ncbi:hypothetical protein [Janibacter alittae]|uniref:Uncharacterized protein n=1 Tax=Janibacter alittae TaxID=3115209 RepID=A0ABZ2MHU5_9MICO
MRVVVDARLCVEGQHGRSILKWGLTRKTLQPGSDDVEDFPTPQTMPGRSAIRIHMEFRGDLLEHLPEPVDYKFTIELLLDDSIAWQVAGTGVLRFGHMVHPDRYITYDNSAEPCSPNEPIEAREALVALASRQNLTLPWQ